MAGRRSKTAAGLFVISTCGSLLLVSLLEFFYPGVDPIISAVLNPLYAWNQQPLRIFIVTWAVVAGAITYYRDGWIAVTAVLGTVYGGLLSVYWPMVVCCEGTFLLFRFDSVADVANGVTLAMFFAALLITAGLAVPGAVVTTLFVERDTPWARSTSTLRLSRRLPLIGAAGLASAMLAGVVFHLVPNGNYIASFLFDPSQGRGSSLVPFLTLWPAGSALVAYRTDPPTTVSLLFGIELGGVLAVKLSNWACCTALLEALDSLPEIASLVQTIGFAVLIAYLLAAIIIAPVSLIVQYSFVSRYQKFLQ